MVRLLANGNQFIDGNLNLALMYKMYTDYCKTIITLFYYIS